MMIVKYTQEFFACVSLGACVSPCVYVCLCVCACGSYVHVSVCLSISVCACVCVHAHYRQPQFTFPLCRPKEMVEFCSRLKIRHTRKIFSTYTMSLFVSPPFYFLTETYEQYSQQFKSEDFYVSYSGLGTEEGGKALKILIGYALVIQSPKYFYFLK